MAGMESDEDKDDDEDEECDRFGEDVVDEQAKFEQAMCVKKMKGWDPGW